MEIRWRCPPENACGNRRRCSRLSRHLAAISRTRSSVSWRELVSLMTSRGSAMMSRTVRRADALAWMAERLFDSGDAPAFAPDRHEIVVHVEAEVLADGRAGRCEIEQR